MIVSGTRECSPPPETEPHPRTNSPYTAAVFDDGSSPADRRDFIRNLVALFAAAGAGLTHAEQRTGGAAPQAAPRERGLVGIQMGPHTMLDEGIEPVLDLIQSSAAIDTIFVY